jgi:hypothetical protein
VGEVIVSKIYTNRGADMWDLNAHVRQLFAFLKEEVKSGQCIPALQKCFRKHFFIIVYRTESEQYTATCVLPAEIFPLCSRGSKSRIQMPAHFFTGHSLIPEQMPTFWFFSHLELSLCEWTETERERQLRGLLSKFFPLVGHKHIVLIHSLWDPFNLNCHHKCSMPY